MKTNIFLASLLLAIACSSCEYDNYDAPEVKFQGQLLTPDGDPYPFDSAVGLLRLYQEGFGKVDNGIDCLTDDSGHFQQLLYTQRYKLTLVNRQLPFEIVELPYDPVKQAFDTLYLDVKGPLKQNLTVRPYYAIHNLQCALNGKRIEATFDIIKQPGTSAPAPNVKRVYIFLSPTVLVNSSVKCSNFSQIKDKVTPDSLASKVNIPLSRYRDPQYYLANHRSYAYYRVALLLDGINDYYIMSDVRRIDDLPETVE